MFIRSLFLRGSLAAATGCLGSATQRRRRTQSNQQRNIYHEIINRTHNNIISKKYLKLDISLILKVLGGLSERGKPEERKI